MKDPVSHQNPLGIYIRIFSGLSSEYSTYFYLSNFSSEPFLRYSLDLFQHSHQNLLGTVIRIISGFSSKSSQYSHQKPLIKILSDSHQNFSRILIRIFSGFFRILIRIFPGFSPESFHDFSRFLAKLSSESFLDSRSRILIKILLELSL